MQILSRGNQTRPCRTVMLRYFSQPHAQVQSKPCAVLHVCIGNGGSQLPTLQSSDHTMIDSTHRASETATKLQLHIRLQKSAQLAELFIAPSPSLPLFPLCLSAVSQFVNFGESVSAREENVITVTYVARYTFVKIEMAVPFDDTCFELRPYK